MTRRTVSGILAAAVATAGTFTVGYPTGTTRGDFSLGVTHKLSCIGKVFSAPENMTLSFGATSVTVTYQGTTTLPAGAPFTFQFDVLGECNPALHAASGQAIYTPFVLGNLDLGSPGAPAANNVCLAQAVAGAAALTLNGALVASSVAVMDARTGRALVTVSSNAGDTTQTITVTGTDMYGVAMKETIALNGTTIVAGKKAFKRITAIAASAALAGNITVGTGDVIGLPIYVPNAAMILKESIDGAAATAGTIVAGLALSTKPTATNADIRGTYDPNSTTDGSRAFGLLAAIPDPTFLGATQFTS